MQCSLPLKWHGGKQYLASRLVSLFPPRDDYLTYIEPFFGGGAVLFEHDPDGKSEVVNDLHGELSNFWNVLKNESTFAMFARIVQATPFSQTEFESAVRDDRSTSPPVWRAWAFFVRYRQSRQGLGKCFATLSRTRTRRGMNEQASSWLSAVENLPGIHNRLKRVVILNDYACSVIKRQDDPRALFYCDPPYLHATRSVTDAYDHEMSESEHAGLLGILSAIKGRFLLSGYRSTLYDKIADAFRWRRVDFLIDNKASGSKTKELKTECVWMNY